MSKFHSLKVQDITRETADTVSISFDVPAELKDKFKYKSGQYLNLKLHLNGEELRRSYSLCSHLSSDNEYRIAVKRVEGGKASNYLNDQLHVGDSIEVSEPEGTFTADERAGRVGSYVFITGGSGITPAMSLMKGILFTEENSQCTLFYTNRNEDSIIFKNQLKELEDQYNGRLKVFHVLTQANDEAAIKAQPNGDLFIGRPDRKRMLVWFNQVLDMGIDHEFFLCGPSGLMDAAKQAVEILRLDPGSLHYEYFETPEGEENEIDEAVQQESQATIILDDEEFEITIPKGMAILDAAMKNDLDVPYSCRGAVCSSCIAKLENGSVQMRQNFVLTDEEIKDGFILTCQSLPTAAKIKVDYDA